MEDQLKRTLGVSDAVVVGLGAMVGAGIFAALAPAARAAGGSLLAALGVAGLVAYCNAHSSARLAARYPASGGTYVYGRERLGPFWGYLAGWGFVIGKTASCAAMALTVGAYLWPGRQHAVAVAAVVALTAASYGGVQRSARVARLIVAVVLAVLAGVVVVCLSSEAADPGRLSGSDRGVLGLLQGAGLLFFAFAGYARITTLGEEVRDPERTIPRAVPIALGIALLVYAAVAVAALSVLGAEGLAQSSAPLADAVRAAGGPDWPRWSGWARPWPRWGRCWRSCSGFHGPFLRWPGTAVCRVRWRPYIPGIRFRTMRSWQWVWSWRCWRPPPICGARSVSPPSECSSTTRSRTPPRGLSIQLSRVGPWQWSDWPAVWCWRVRCPSRRRPGGRRCWRWA
ncbi:hypothetical protein GCM10010425_03770 [Streptomyces spororaveus]|uniref:Amino acid permease-like protein n=1 Tax=Streptomyces spororaveus TaxID=284039 RepID=A0ABQ3TDA5_9ACTN|nr:hypothetical protein Sspor_39560 [Streptomyces spororaveus]